MSWLKPRPTRTRKRVDRKCLFRGYPSLLHSGQEDTNHKEIRVNVKTRTFSARTAEKIRHPASFNRDWAKSGAARKGWPPASS
jgi:hypothetical protein